MCNRDFSDSVKLKVLKANLEKHSGKLCCELCNVSLSSIRDCHFDHIYPFAKGGKSTADNCQLLCTDCNLKKNDKELRDYVLEEKARLFLKGSDMRGKHEQPAAREINHEMTRELFAKCVGEFIEKNGSISKLDFSREYNNLPSIHYVRQYYGDLYNLKKAFGLEDISHNWNRERIKKALLDFVAEHGTVYQKDMKTENKLPSVPCVLRYYPECRNFTDIKRVICGLSTHITWTPELAVRHGKQFVSEHGRITQKDLRSENNLPSSRIVRKLFGTLGGYQAAVGAEVLEPNQFISKKEISNAVERYFGDRERGIESQKTFCESFEISQSTISKRYGVFSAFCEDQGIRVLFGRKGKYSRREVDDKISVWIREKNSIPKSNELSKLGLPSRDVILKYYDDWREPFYIYRRLYEEVNRH